ncbi:MAG: YkvA family protein [Stenomitos frigidus ULC029]
MKDSITGWYRNVIRNPKYRWWIIGGSLLYLLSPFDISPDFIPIVGWIDDGLIATLLVAELSTWALERLRVRKGETATPTVNSTVSGTPSDTTTVDVNAVSTK